MNLPYPPEHYYQNQGMVPRTGPVECVTTSVVMVMNMVKDRLAQDLGMTDIPDIRVDEYVQKLDQIRLAGLRYRFSSNFPLAGMRGWMLPFMQVPRALRQFAGELQRDYGCSFQVKQTSGNTLEEIRKTLKNGNFVLVHGLWPVTKSMKLHYLFGGFPHTMVPVQVDYRACKVILLNPAEPHPMTIQADDPATRPEARLYEMSIQEFMEFWGRRSFLNLYARPFTMTLVIPETRAR
jgi:hypothetical protein